MPRQKIFGNIAPVLIDLTTSIGYLSTWQHAEAAMTHDSRKAALAAYRERKVVAGIYALVCQPTGEIWVGETPNLEGILNRNMFSLRVGSHPVASVQEAFRRHGESAFAFEVLESLEDEDIAAVRNKWLRDRVAHWRTARGAATL
jgi:hypothetical protein